MIISQVRGLASLVKDYQSLCLYPGGLYQRRQIERGCLEEVDPEEKPATVFICMKHHTPELVDLKWWHCQHAPGGSTASMRLMSEYVCWNSTPIKMLAAQKGFPHHKKQTPQRGRCWAGNCLVSVSYASRQSSAAHQMGCKTLAQNSGATIDPFMISRGTSEIYRAVCALGCIHPPRHMDIFMESLKPVEI